ncbi:hypothetical protein BDW75DRAFT_237142 [Aspergillus navahoensis]
MALLICVCFLLASLTGAFASPISPNTTTSLPATHLFAFDFTCTELSTFNNAITPLLNLTTPSGTPQAMVPHVNRRLSAISSFVSGYQNMMNTFNMNNCAGSGHSSLQARQGSQPNPFVEAICAALEGADTSTLPQQVIDLIDEMELALGCSTEIV